MDHGLSPDKAAPGARLPVMSGRCVRLEPLSRAHARDLCKAMNHSDRDELTRYMVQPPPPEGLDAFESWIERKAASRERSYLACVRQDDGRALGYLCLMRDEPEHRSVEIGDVVFTPPFRRTAASTEAIYLLARHAFEAMGYRRLEWKCNTLNELSRRAALRFGFTFEGVFRQHMIVRGFNRDSTWFSMLDGEWPMIKAAFEAWLAPANFDAEGRQRAALATFRVREPPGS